MYLVKLIQFDMKNFRFSENVNLSHFFASVLTDQLIERLSAQIPNISLDHACLSCNIFTDLSIYLYESLVRLESVSPSKLSPDFRLGDFYIQSQATQYKDAFVFSIKKAFSQVDLPELNMFVVFDKFSGDIVLCDFGDSKTAQAVGMAHENETIAKKRILQKAMYEKKVLDPNTTSSNFSFVNGRLRKNPKNS